MAVPKIMHANPFRATLLTSSFHFMIQKAFCYIEKPLIRFVIYQTVGIILYQLTYMGWQADFPIALRRLRLQDQIFPV